MAEREFFRFVGRKRLVDGVGIDCEMPSEVSERIVIGFQTTALEEAGVGAGSCSRDPVLGLNRDVTGLVSSLPAFGKVGLADFKRTTSKARRRGTSDGAPRKGECRTSLLFNVLDLLADLFEFRFGSHHVLTNAGIVGF